MKRNSDMCNQYSCNTDGNQHTSEKSAKLLGINIDNKLSFDEHVPLLCKRASNKLKAISRLYKYLGFKKKNVLINSFVYANFNYSPSVWHFCLATSVREIEQIQTRAIRILYNDFYSDYKALLDKSGKCIMEIKRLITAGLEVFRTLKT